MTKEHKESLRFLTMSELMDDKRQVDSKDAAWQSECSYRRGAHQALSMMRQWLDLHPHVNARTALDAAEDIAYELRFGDPGRRDFFMDKLIEKLQKKLRIVPEPKKT